MNRVIIESPYAGDISLNRAYAQACLRDSLSRGEAPIASHLLYPQVLDEHVEAERRWGIEAGLAWMAEADLVVLYEDFGRSRGMLNALCEAQRLCKRTEVRYLLGPKQTDSSPADKAKQLGLRYRWWHFFTRPPLASPTRRERGKSISKNSWGRYHDDRGQTINETLARNAPSPVPWGEGKQE